MLVYGDICQQETSDEDFESQMYSGMEESLDHSDNWIKFLKPLAKVCNEDGTPLLGWFRFSDVLQVMPVTILCRSIDIAGEVSRGCVWLQEKCTDFFENFRCNL